MLRELAAVALLLSCTSCAALSDFLATPLPSGSAPMPESQPVDLELPDGTGSVSYTPPPPSDTPTVGDAIGSTAGTLLGVLTGNAALGLALGAAGVAAVGAAGRKRSS